MIHAVRFFASLLDFCNYFYQYFLSGYTDQNVIFDKFIKPLDKIFCTFWTENEFIVLADFQP